MYRSYKHKTSDYKSWKQKPHAKEYLLYPQNISSYLSIDEVSLSQGELYTFVTSKEGKGKNGTIVAMIASTDANTINEVLEKLPISKRLEVKEITLDMARNMESAARKSFPHASIVTDRFHVVKLVLEALQHLRIKYRWEAIDKENENIKAAKIKRERYQTEVFSNGDTLKQLLTRGRYLLYKQEADWTATQQLRAVILFSKYPLLKKAYQYAIQFRNIYQNNNMENAKRQFMDWINEIKQTELTEFNSAAKSIAYHFDNILNFFINRNTNANAESFNSKIKLFRANQKGVRDVSFFLFRMEKLFA
ncbi:MAG: transposase [Bacteroidota bacterium]